MKYLFFQQIKKFSQVKKSLYFMEQEYQFGCHNYHQLPVVIAKGKGIYILDQERKKQINILTAYSAVNQELVKQAIQLKLTLSPQEKKQYQILQHYISLNFKNITQLFKYDKVQRQDNLQLNQLDDGHRIFKFSGNQAGVLFANCNYWGRTIAGCGNSDDYKRHQRLCPLGGFNFDIIDYNITDAMENEFNYNPNYDAISLETIQGEYVVIIPDQNYLNKQELKRQIYCLDYAAYVFLIMYLIPKCNPIGKCET